MEEILNDVTSGFSNIGHKFEYVGEMNINTIVDKRDKTYDFYIKHNMLAVRWAINEKLSKNNILKKKFFINWRHPIYRKYGNPLIVNE